MTREFKETLIMLAVIIVVLLMACRCGSEYPTDFTYAPYCVPATINGQQTMICSDSSYNAPGSPQAASPAPRPGHPPHHGKPTQPSGPGGTNVTF